MNPRRCTQEQKLLSFEAHLAEMDRLGVDEITFGESPFLSTINRREVLNTLAALRGEPAIDWARPKVDERERAGRHGGSGVCWSATEDRWVVSIRHQGKIITGARSVSLEASQKAAYKLRQKLGVFRSERTHCEAGHLQTRKNVHLYERRIGEVDYICRVCREKAKRELRARQKAARLAAEQMKEAA